MLRLLPLSPSHFASIFKQPILIKCLTSEGNRWRHPEVVKGPRKTSSGVQEKNLHPATSNPSFFPTKAHGAVAFGSDWVANFLVFACLVTPTVQVEKRRNELLDLDNREKDSEERVKRAQEIMEVCGDNSGRGGG